MVTLIEIKDAGLDSTNIHLLDEIPNLSYFPGINSSLNSQLHNEQKNSFINNTPKKAMSNITGSLSYKYYQFIEENPDTKYNNTLKLNYNNIFFSDLKLRREFSGRERITYRNLKYINNKSIIKNISIGNFTKRLGLGTIFGHRGKLLSFSRDINNESLLFPDYGGYNGMYGLAEYNNFRMQTLFSHNRDENISLTSYGIMLTNYTASFQPGLILGVNKIKNRDSKNIVNDIKIGMNYSYKYKGGSNSFEAAYQGGDNKNLAAIVTEGRHRFKDAVIKYAGWAYHDNLIDISAGSKSLYLSSRDTLDQIDYTYSNKRAGQKGMLLKTIIALNTNSKFTNSLLYGRKNRDSLEVQWLTIFTQKISRQLLLSVTYLSKYKKLNKINSPGDNIKRQTKIEMRYRTNKIYWRNYIGYYTQSAKKDYLSIFSNIKYEKSDSAIIELWLNVGKIDLKNWLLDYWYGFIRNELKLATNIKTAVKLSHTYNRNSDMKNRTLLSFELNMII